MLPSERILLLLRLPNWLLLFPISRKQLILFANGSRVSRDRHQHGRKPKPATRYQGYGRTGRGGYDTVDLIWTSDFQADRTTQLFGYSQVIDLYSS